MPDLNAAIAALKNARRYVDGAYECAFPDTEENTDVLAEVDAAILTLEKSVEFQSELNLHYYWLMLNCASLLKGFREHIVDECEACQDSMKFSGEVIAKIKAFQAKWNPKQQPEV